MKVKTVSLWVLARSYFYLYGIEWQYHVANTYHIALCKN